ncbi:MAG: hypothetical protein LBI89_03635 [Prevotellaceae bacterium]|nr:hypothetical protein [Prevotellaceae bacterium]
MKHFFKYLFAGLLVCTYGLSVIGVGVHYCRCEEAGRVVLLAVDHHDCSHDHPRAEDPHACCHEADAEAAAPCAPSSETDAVAGGACCTVQVELLQSDQHLPALQKIFSGFYTIFSYCLPAAFSAGSVPAPVTVACSNPPPLFNAGHSSFSRMQQWRL